MQLTHPAEELALPLSMLPGQLTACDTFGLPVPGTRGECQHFHRCPMEALSSQQTGNQQQNEEIIPPIPPSKPVSNL